MKRVAIAVVALLALTGCTEIGSFSDKVQIDSGMERLTGKLAELGLETDYTAEMTPEYKYVVYASASGPELSEQQLVEVAGIVRAELSTGIFASIAEEFDRSGSRFTLSSPEGIVFAIDDYVATEEQVADAIAYSYAISEAYGAPSSLAISMANESVEGSYYCGVAVLGTRASPDWDAIRALGDSDCSLGFPGLSLDGRELDAALTDLIDGLGAVAPLLEPYGAQDAFVTVDATSSDLSVSFVAPAFDVSDPTASVRWPSAVDIARVLLESGLPMTFYVYPSGASAMSAVAIGSCSEVVFVSEGDAVVAAALTAALGAEVKAGYCVHA